MGNLADLTHQERVRVALLHTSGLVQAIELPPAFAALTRTAACVTGSSQAAIELIDAQLVHVLTSHGPVHKPLSREAALSSLVNNASKLWHSADIRSDTRCHIALLSQARTGTLPAAFAAHALIVEGHVLGALCVACPEPHAWSDIELRNLTDVAEGVTELMLAEVLQQRSRRMDARVRTASLAGQDWLWESDAEGRTVWISSTMAQHLALPTEPELGRCDTEFYQALPGEAYAAQWAQFLHTRAQQMPFSNVLAQRITPRGRVIVSMSGIPVFNRHGEFMGYRGSSRDVTRQVQTELEIRRAQTQLLSQQTQLQESETRLSAVLHALPDIWFVFDERNHYVDGHHAHPLLLNPIEELRGQPLGYGLPTDLTTAQLATLAKVRETGKSHQLEYTLRTNDGVLRHFEARCVPMGRQHVLLLARDITKLKEAERTVLDKQAAEAANAAKSSFVSRMSHEIRTPLNAISGFAQLLQRQMHESDVDQTQQSFVKHILDASGHLTALVNDILDLQRIEVGALRCEAEVISLATTIEGGVTMLEPLAKHHNIQLVHELDPECMVLADRQRLSQVVMNLGSNAIKYNTTGGLVRFTVEAFDELYMALHIEDTGPGMSEAQTKRLFQPFERLGKELSNIEGTGLGLIITRSLIEAMGGQLSIHSQTGVGTRATVLLPRHAPTATEAPSLAPPLAPTDESSKLSESSANEPLSVLYVEDNRINAMLFEESLRPYKNIALAVADTAQSALAKLDINPPDVLVLDAHLPDMSGLDLLQAIRRMPALRHTPAYMCSADAMPEDIARAKAAGFVGYWTKPIDIRQITQVLADLVEKKNASNA